ncbi:MAG: SMC-Scp complex subunit ScpB [Gammaproteobacteria bacterium]|nr:SMC-Scp complex subunit ScpB [Gammaproteobacteria bacterium]
MTNEVNELKNILEGALLAAGRPLSIEQLGALFENEQRPAKSDIKQHIVSLQGDYEGRGIELAEVASGYRFQVREAYSSWVGRLWEEKPARYSRAMLETLSLVAYRQPITRGEIESIRGVAVSTHIIKSLSERSWVRIVGHRDVPGRPAMYATTREFLDYFNLKSLDELPPLADIRDFGKINEELQFENLDVKKPLTEVGIPPKDGESTQLESLSSDVDASVEKQELEEQV